MSSLDQATAVAPAATSQQAALQDIACVFGIVRLGADQVTCILCRSPLTCLRHALQSLYVVLLLAYAKACEVC